MLKEYYKFSKVFLHGGSDSPYYSQIFYECILKVSIGGGGRGRGSFEDDSEKLG